MKTSNEIGKLATALVKAQQAIGPASKNSTNPFLKSSYAGLDSVVAAIKDALADNGLSYVQMPSTPPADYGLSVALTTRLMHTSGEWLEDTFIMPLPSEERGKSLMQVAGSGISYARRYALSAMLGVVTGEDTDATVEAQRDTRGNNSPQGQAEREGERPSRNGGDDVFLLKDDVKLRKQFHAIGTEAYGPDWNEKRKELIATWGHESSNDLTIEQTNKLIAGMNKKLES